MHECPMLLNGLAEALGKLELVKPGRDFKVITLSFDDKDTPAIALDKKRNYVKAIGKPFPTEDWTFLTGDAVAIKKFTDSIGFKFQRDSEHDFSHPVTLVVIAPGGKIVRYLEGTSFLPFEVTMALDRGRRGQGRISGAQGAHVLLQLRSAQKVLCVQYSEGDRDGDGPVCRLVLCVPHDHRRKKTSVCRHKALSHDASG